MTTSCPKCGSALSFRDKRCLNPRCDFVPSIGGILRHYLGGFFLKLVTVEVPLSDDGTAPIDMAECPKCHAFSPRSSKRCDCGADFSGAKPQASRLFQQPQSQRTRVLRRLYVFLSFVALIVTFYLAEDAYQKTGYVAVVIGSLQIFVSLIFFSFLLPKNMRSKIIEKTPAIVKLGIILNYFTTILLLVWFAGRSTPRAIFVTLLLLGALIALRFALRFLPDANAHDFDFRKEQGRNARTY